MTQAFRPTALVVEDDQIQQMMLTVLLQETDMDVIQCDTGEAAALVLQEVGCDLCFSCHDERSFGNGNAGGARRPVRRFEHLEENAFPSLSYHGVSSVLARKGRKTGNFIQFTRASVHMHTFFPANVTCNLANKRRR